MFVVGPSGLLFRIHWEEAEDVSVPSIQQWSCRVIERTAVEETSKCFG